MTEICRLTGGLTGGRAKFGGGQRGCLDIYCRISVRKREGVRGRLLSLKKRAKAYLFSSQLFLEMWETEDAVFLNLRLMLLPCV